jgi:hypothetical protein
MQDANTFSVMEGNIDGYPMVAMIKEGLQEFKSKGNTPWFLGFSIPLSESTPQGLPTATEADDLNRWEDLLDGEIHSRCRSIFIGRVTWRGNRELLYYIDDPQQIIPRIQELIDGRTLRPFAFRCEQDPTWMNVRVYLK